VFRSFEENDKSDDDNVQDGGGKMNPNDKCILIVSIMVLPIVLMSGCTDRGQEEHQSPVKFYIEFDSMESRTTGSGTLWDFYFTVNKKDPLDYEVPWSKVNPRFVDDRNHVIEQIYVLDRFVIGSDPGEELRGWYEELSGIPTGLDFLDRIIITGLDTSYQGMELWIYSNGLFMDSYQFPDTFA
jgi:hypothetical protein